MPETLTELSELFVIHTIYRHLEKQHNKQTLLPEKISDLPKPILTVINQLSKLAWSGLKSYEQKLVFTYDEVEKKCPKIDEIPNGFGLLQAVQHHSLKGVGSTCSFCFLHLTIQEFLAAHYVATLPSDVQSDVAFREGLGEHIWLMYVGIVGINCASFIDFQNNYTKETTSLLFLFQCYLEAKQFAPLPENISSIFEDGYIHICSETMQPYNMISLINFIMKSSTRFTYLVLSDCQITDEGMQILQEFFTDHPEKVSSLEYVSLEHNHISSMCGTYRSVCDESTLSRS